MFVAVLMLYLMLATGMTIKTLSAPKLGFSALKELRV